MLTFTSSGSIAFGLVITSPAAFAVTHTLAQSPVTLVSSLGATDAGTQKYVTNTSAGALTLQVANSNASSVLQSYTLQPGSNAMFGWAGTQWYRFF